MLAASNEETKERLVEVYREEKRKVKRCIYQSKKKANKQFGWKMNLDGNGNRNCFGRRCVMRKEKRWRVAAE